MAHIDVIRGLGSAILDLLLPPCCATCGGGLSSGSLCEACATQLERIGSPRCPRCGVPFSGVGGDHDCGQCLLSPPPFLTATASFVYFGPIADGLRALKYGPRPERIRPLAELWRQSRPPLPEVDLGLAVPLHPRKLRERGFNQTVQLAKPLLKERSIPLATGLLLRTRDDRSQASQKDADRRRAPFGAFEVPSRRGRERLSGRRVLLLDDVVTTGATAGACAAALLEAGAAEVHVAALARTVKWS